MLLLGAGVRGLGAPPDFANNGAEPLLLREWPSRLDPLPLFTGCRLNPPTWMNRRIILKRRAIVHALSFPPSSR